MKFNETLDKKIWYKKKKKKKKNGFVEKHSINLVYRSIWVTDKKKKFVYAQNGFHFFICFQKKYFHSLGFTNIICLPEKPLPLQYIITFTFVFVVLTKSDKRFSVSCMHDII